MSKFSKYSIILLPRVPAVVYIPADGHVTLTSCASSVYRDRLQRITAEQTYIVKCIIIIIITRGLSKRFF